MYICIYVRFEAVNFVHSLDAAVFVSVLFLFDPVFILFSEGSSKCPAIYSKDTKGAKKMKIKKIKEKNSHFRENSILSI